jgi:hypothetical protein
MAALHGEVLTVTQLGRSIKSEAKEKHCIKRADRLLSNRRLQGERAGIYTQLTKQLIGSKQHPLISVEWSALDESKRHFLLRASVPIEGRSLTLYEEVHTMRSKEKPKVHEQFLKTLQKMLPPGVVPSSSPTRGSVPRGSSRSKRWVGTGWGASAIAMRCNCWAKRSGSPARACTLKRPPFPRRWVGHA